MRSVAWLMAVLLLTSCQVMKNDQPSTVRFVDLERYSGLWYEIASYPARFQDGCHCSTAEYTLSENGRYIVVKNRCRDQSATGPWRSIEGKAFVTKDSGNAKLKVQFFWPFRASYWIVGLADDYSWALVSGPSRRYLWVLSRTPDMAQETYQALVHQLQANGFDTDKLVLRDQSCGSER